MFLPTSHHLVGLLELLHAREGRRNQAGGDSSSPLEGGKADEGKGANGAGKKRGRGGGGGTAAAAAAELDLSAIAGLGKEDLRLAEVQSAVSRGAAGLIAREAVCYRWSAGLPELCTGIEARLGRLLDGGGAGGGIPADGGAGRLRARLRALQVSLGKAAAEAVARRARGSKHPGEAGPVDTFRGMVRLVSETCRRCVLWQAGPRGSVHGQLYIVVRRRDILSLFLAGVATSCSPEQLWKAMA